MIIASCTCSHEKLPDFLWLNQDRIFDKTHLCLCSSLNEITVENAMGLEIINRLVIYPRQTPASTLLRRRCSRQMLYDQPENKVRLVVGWEIELLAREIGTDYV